MSSARLVARSSLVYRRAAVVSVLTVGMLGLGSVAADAHVRVHADSTAAGSFSQLTFRVPNESPTAGTVKVEAQLPQDTPFAFVSVKPVPGWKADVKEAKLPQPIENEGTTLTKAARTVTWTAEKGTQIAPGQYQEFSISAGPLPDPKQLLLPTLQTYSDGEVVSWDEPTPASGEEPETPRRSSRWWPPTAARRALPPPTRAAQPRPPPAAPPRETAPRQRLQSAAPTPPPACSADSASCSASWPSR